MTETELLTLIRGGENIRVEFKKSTNDVTKDVYDTVCSFSNREGGIIVLGVKDNGEVLGIDPDAIDRIKKDFVTSINNGQKINPPLYLQPETYTVDERTVLVIQVPVSSQVCRHHGRIFDRSHESDIDITDNSDMVYQLYARKSGSYFVNKVTRFQLSDLRSDLIERARMMTTSRTANHPWKSMSDEELLRSAGLILKDEEKQTETPDTTTVPAEAEEKEKEKTEETPEVKPEFQQENTDETQIPGQTELTKDFPEYCPPDMNPPEEIEQPPKAYKTRHYYMANLPEELAAVYMAKTMERTIRKMTGMSYAVLTKEDFWKEFLGAEVDWEGNEIECVN